MELKAILEYQANFDNNHVSNFNWNTKVSQKNIDVLQFLLISLVGEMGETSNIVKKIIRGDFSLEEKREDLEEEIIDMFIYMLKLCNQLDVDVENKYLEKMEKNKARFIKYEK